MPRRKRHPRTVPDRPCSKFQPQRHETRLVGARCAYCGWTIHVHRGVGGYGLAEPGAMDATR